MGPGFRRNSGRSRFHALRVCAGGGGAGWPNVNRPAAEPVGSPVDFTRVLRGGSWNNNQDNARSANRNRNNPNNRNNNIGFRVVCVARLSVLPVPGALHAPGGCGRPEMRACSTSGIVRRPWFADRGEEGKMARARPVRTARSSLPRLSGI
jgi:hypothetical protein